MAKFAQDYLPGSYGTDYEFVSYGGKVYVVYRVGLGGGKTLQMSWVIPKEDLEHYGASGRRVKRISRDQFQGLQFFGEASQITQTGGADEHPFQKYLKELSETYPEASWLNNSEFVGTLLEGWVEQWDGNTLQQRLENTKWYQSRTDRERDWEQMADAQKQAEIKSMQVRMMESAKELLGAGFNLRDLGISPKEFEEDVLKVVSGAWGDPEYGFLVWSTKLQRKSSRVEGTPAWIEKQQGKEEQRAFLNRPEELAFQLQQQAFEWLGPGALDKDTVKKWAEKLVSKTKTQADWEQFLRRQAQALYPWLGPEESWQERASSYKAIAEDLLGQPVGWDDKLLKSLGAADAKGVPNGAALGYDDFERAVRSTNRFWKGPVARDEGYAMIAKIDEMFRGVSY